MKAMFGLLLVLGAPAQTFDAAAVKPAGPRVPGQRMLTADPGRTTFPRATLAILIMHAFDIWSDQIAGPSWLSDFSAVYSVTATMPPGTTKEQWKVMLQNLLAERFRLRLHHEQQIRPGYELVIAERGHKLKPWSPTDFVEPKALSFVFPSSGVGRGHVNTRDTMAGFCRVLAFAINTSNGIPIGPQARIVDRTGLDGVYEFHLEFTGVMATHPTPEALDELASDPGLTVFTAVETQLGLKLRKTKGVAVDVLVVDHADKVPTEN
jgi:uncharacterized protein (TIGR03435 family)